MLKVAYCITVQHDLKLVVLAAIICALGSWVTFRLFDRGASDHGWSNLGWQFLAATAAGSSIWSTHFIAMLAFETGAPVIFDPVRTIISLLVAIIGAIAALSIAGARSKHVTLPGGILLGLAASAMHYIGMSGYHIEGFVNWNIAYVGASVLIALVFSVASVSIAKRSGLKHRTIYGAATFGAGIIGLHFTGMTAMQITPLVLGGADIQPNSFGAMALAIALACFVIAGTGLISFLIDNRSRRDSDRKLHHLALFDSMTGLPNRSNLTDRMTREFAAATRDKPLAYIGMDLDRFKEVNDVRGHTAGDQVLSAVGERLRVLSTDTLFFARIGGDEFGALCKSGDEKTLIDNMMAIKSALVAPIKLDDGAEVTVGVSLGAAVFPIDAADQQDLVHKADLAMYRAKSSATTSICFYDAAMDETVRLRKALAADLRKAISNNELALYYQVQNAVATKAITGFEVLLRWEHPERGFIPPAEFIPIAEESGQIIEIGKWVLKTACAQAALWPHAFRIAVNLSPIQLVDQDLPDMVAAILEETGMPPERLELELTESTIVENRERALEMIHRIKKLGITIALDDFGTGYSSLETLRSFPFDKIKLDRSFMDEIEESPQARAIVRAVLALGKSLEIPVLAEGVETSHQLDILSREGCDAAQGYYLGRPVPLAKVLQDFISLDKLADEAVAQLTSVIMEDNAGPLRAKA